MHDAAVAVALPSREEIAAAAEAIRPYAVRTPLLRLKHPGTREIYIKLENLQPIGSFKVRCAANALLARRALNLSHVTTASAGNFAQGLAYAGKALGIAVTTHVPETAAQSKLDALEALGAAIVRHSFTDWWAMIADVARSKADPAFIHPVADTAVLAGNATIGLEIAEDLPQVSSVLVPFGGGGLAVGIAAALRGRNPSVAVYASETEAGTPVAAAFAAGEPVPVAFNPHTFITGMGSGQVLAPMWPLVRGRLAGAVHSSLKEVADAVRHLVLAHHIVAEGAGAAPVAAAMAGAGGGGPVVCIVSGGHLDPGHLTDILDGRTPGSGPPVDHHQRR